MSDLISRQAAIDAVNDVIVDYIPIMYGRFGEIPLELALAIERLPTADLFEYSDKLWKTAYERGKAEAYPKKGKWIPITNGRMGFECNQCRNYAPSYQNGVEWLSDFCPNCGARMEESDE